MRKTRLAGRRGAAAQQYAVIVGLIAVFGIAAVASLGLNVKALLTRTSNALGDVSNTGSNGGGGSGGGGGGGSGPLYAWGQNDLGQAVPPGPTNRLVPTLFSGVTDFVDIHAGYTFSCGRTGGGQVRCWGDQSNGRLGNGVNTGSTATPTALNTGGAYNGSNMTSVATGFNNSCGLAGGTVVCWGAGGSGVNGQSDPNIELTSPANIQTGGAYNGSNAKAVTHTAANGLLITTDGQILAWGTATDYLLGNGTTSGYSSIPTPVQIGSSSYVMSPGNADKISGGTSHACAITTGGTAFCWGTNTFYERGAASVMLVPNNVNSGGGYTGSNMAQISAGRFFTCGITTGGTAVCWGINNSASGSLGNGNGADSENPVAISQTGGVTASNVTQIRAGFDNTGCVLLTTGAAACWGKNANGLLGQNDTTIRYTPTAVTGGLLFQRLSTPMQRHVLAITQ